MYSATGKSNGFLTPSSQDCHVVSNPRLASFRPERQQQALSPPTNRLTAVHVYTYVSNFLSHAPSSAKVSSRSIIGTAPTRIQKRGWSRLRLSTTRNLIQATWCSAHPRWPRCLCAFGSRETPHTNQNYSADVDPRRPFPAQVSSTPLFPSSRGWALHTFKDQH